MIPFFQRCTGLLIAGLLLCTVAYGQDPDSQDYWLSFYPLHQGHVWQYDISQYGHSFNYHPYKEVIGDTVLANGKRYQIVDVRSGSGFNNRIRLVRIDSTQMVTYWTWPPGAASSSAEIIEQPGWPLPISSESRSVDYNVVGGTVTMACEWERDVELFGTMSDMWTCRDNIHSPYNWTQVKMAPGIGIYYVHEEVEGPGPYIRELRYTNAPGFELGVLVGTEQPDGNSVNEQVSVYPNPARIGQNVFIDDMDISKSYHLSWYDLTGRMVEQVTISAGARYEMVLSHRFVPGLYLGTLVSQDGHQILKLIVLDQ